MQNNRLLERVSVIIFTVAGLVWILLLGVSNRLDNEGTIDESFRTYLSIEVVPLLLEFEAGSRLPEGTHRLVDVLPSLAHTTDPYGNQILVIYPGEVNRGSFDLRAYGPDRVRSDDDFGNWKK